MSYGNGHACVLEGKLGYLGIQLIILCEKNVRTDDRVMRQLCAALLSRDCMIVYAEAQMYGEYRALALLTLKGDISAHLFYYLVGDCESETGAHVGGA